MFDSFQGDRPTDGYRARSNLVPDIMSGPGSKKRLPDSGQKVTLGRVRSLSTSSFSDSTGADLPRATATLCGPFRVKLDGGRDITPTSPLRQGLLAVLVSAPEQIKARKSLQSMFWASADPSHAAANLRTALYELRRDLEALGHDVVRADRQTVSLCPGVLTADLDGSAGREILEGLDLHLSDCDGFEDWLRTLRQTDNRANPEANAAVPESTDRSPVAGKTAGVRLSRPSQPVRMALGLLPTVHAGFSGVVLVQVEAIVDQIAQFFGAATLLDVHDLRDTSARIQPLPLASGQGPTHFLQSLVFADGNAIRLRLRLVEAHTRKLIWLSDPLALSCTDEGTMAWRLGEMIVDRMRSHPPLSGAPDLFPYTALTAFFSLDAALIDETEAQLLRMVGQGRHPVLDCLLLFAHVFKMHEQLGASSEFDIQHLISSISDLPASDPLLPLCQSLLGYALHMLRGENDFAFHLIENAYQLAPNLALNLDHLAVINLVRGDLSSAEGALRRLMVVGQQSPWRYTYDITGAMVHMMRGDLRQSLQCANQAMFRKPRFLAALRYSMIGFALSNRPEDAARMLARIRVLRPGYDLSSWADGFVSRMPLHLAKTTVQSLRQIELL